jgi:hypothetical protein
MYNPYDTDNALALASINDKIRGLNDAFGRSP